MATLHTITIRFIGCAFCFLAFSPVYGASDLEIKGQVAFPGQWTFFGPFENEDPLPGEDALQTVPQELTLGDRTVPADTVTPINNQYNFVEELGGPGQQAHRVVYVFVPLDSPSEQTATIGLGGDYQVQAWLNGEEIFDNTDQERGQPFPPAINHYLVHADLKAGDNLLVVRLISGNASSIVAIGGPDELRHGNFKSLLDDPFLTGEERWTRPDLRVAPRDKSPVEIGSRLELFIDDYLLDGKSGGAERRLHHPVHRNVIMELDKPWDGNITAYLSVVQDDDRILLYYNATPAAPNRQTTAVIESEDGIHFTRPNLGRVEFEGSTDNNLLFESGPAGGASGHNFAPFLDENPKALPEQRFKGTGYRRFSVYASPDGFDWEQLAESVIEEGPYDSQNVAFWDPNHGFYAGYIRDFPEERGGIRDIRRSVSKDFIEWTEPEGLQYFDDRWETLYTNTIRPYFRAPHLYIGTPARFITRRKKVPEHEQAGVSDAILMVSRDGLTFYRWEEGFVRPGPEPENWTDRTNYPAWGMVQTGPDEMSMYWTEHFRHPGMRIRRGSLRLDGFVSLHADAREVGEFLTRPLVFDGDRLEINYATSAIGTIRIELCDENGETLEGFSLEDSDLIFGNEISATATWNNQRDLSELAGQPVRLRIRLHDADLYSIRFTEEQP